MRKERSPLMWRWCPADGRRGYCLVLSDDQLALRQLDLIAGTDRARTLRVDRGPCYSHVMEPGSEGSFVVSEGPVDANFADAHYRECIFKEEQPGRLSLSRVLTAKSPFPPALDTAPFKQCPRRGLF